LPAVDLLSVVLVWTCCGDGFAAAAFSYDVVADAPGPLPVPLLSALTATASAVAVVATAVTGCCWSYCDLWAGDDTDEVVSLVPWLRGSLLP
jgi:hypothetical protein